MPTLILHASARKGDTWKVSTQLSKQLDADLIDLADYEIGCFNYDQVYADNDQFIDLISSKLLHYDTIIFASPVYWYLMSAQMKIFVDRLTDLLMSHKDLGRQLRGKSMGVLSCTNDATYYPTFFQPFRLSADYLGMNYTKEWYAHLRESDNEVVILENELS